ncbi:hypothetical protein EVAR_86692_1 [Eumeta japonica]|uniref:CHK kinase-like domain-containing protein n=1 Tax=Eumeta variegata TaxID=151549 RepID=A0A4C1XWG5_EUMVA|nr:hypothetical protein EVAR_86692_1 [Eumeta japonica]
MVDAERILNELSQTIIENEKIVNPEVIIKSISTGGANYSSTLHLITIKSPDNEDLELFAKVASLGENIRKTMNLDRMFETERFVYKELREIYETLQKKNKVPEKDRLLFPKFYAIRDTYLEDTVVLENLVTKGYTCYDRLKPVTWEYAAAAVGELAKLHALSYAFAKEDPERFNEIAAEKKMEFSGSEEDMLALWEKAVSNALEMTPEESKQRFKKFIDKYQGIDTFKKFYVSPRQPMLVHGDYRASNLMHKITDGKLERLIPVDYQTIHCGSPLTDLFYFIFSGTDGEFRKCYYDELIDHYYNTFADFLIKLNLDPETTYPREHFDEDFKNSLPYGLLVIVFLLPIVLIEAHNAPKMDGDAAITDFIVKPNEMFRERLHEAIRDFEKWGVI